VRRSAAAAETRPQTSDLRADDPRPLRLQLRLPPLLSPERDLDATNDVTITNVKINHDDKGCERVSVLVLPFGANLKLSTCKGG